MVGRGEKGEAVRLSDNLEPISAISVSNAELHTVTPKSVEAAPNSLARPEKSFGVARRHQQT